MTISSDKKLAKNLGVFEELPFFDENWLEVIEEILHSYYQIDDNFNFYREDNAMILRGKGEHSFDVHIEVLPNEVIVHGAFKWEEHFAGYSGEYGSQIELVIDAVSLGLRLLCQNYRIIGYFRDEWVEKSFLEVFEKNKFQRRFQQIQLGLPASYVSKIGQNKNFKDEKNLDVFIKKMKTKIKNRSQGFALDFGSDGQS